MNYRFTLDDNIDADFIALIRQKANGGSENKAMKLFAQNQYAIHIDRNLSPMHQETVSNTSNEDETIDSDTINLSGLDTTFLE